MLCELICGKSTDGTTDGEREAGANHFCVGDTERQRGTRIDIRGLLAVERAYDEGK